MAIAVILYAACHLTHANPYLAAFAAGSTIATLDRVAAERFEHFGDHQVRRAHHPGTHLRPHFGDRAVAVIAILLVRPAAMLLSLLRTCLPSRVGPPNVRAPHDGKTSHLSEQEGIVFAFHRQLPVTSWLFSGIWLP